MCFFLVGLISIPRGAARPPAPPSRLPTICRRPLSSTRPLFAEGLGRSSGLVVLEVVARYLTQGFGRMGGCCCCCYRCCCCACFASGSIAIVVVVFWGSQPGQYLVAQQRRQKPVRDVVLGYCLSRAGGLCCVVLRTSATVVTAAERLSCVTQPSCTWLGGCPTHPVTGYFSPVVVAGMTLIKRVDGTKLPRLRALIKGEQRA